MVLHEIILNIPIPSGKKNVSEKSCLFFVPEKETTRSSDCLFYLHICIYLYSFVADYQMLDSAMV